MERIFISSSADLRDLRASIGQRLGEWLRRHGFKDMVQPYLWEDETEGGRLLSDRARVQSQLPDPFAPDIPLTICIFGERCGNPLEDTFDDEPVARLDRWRATGDKPGFLHPWPRADRDASRQALEHGQFPLTGTVFELLSAHLKDTDANNLIVGYVASIPIEDHTAADDINFNDRRLWQRLVDRKTKAEADKIGREIYDPQIIALLNLIKYISRTFRFVEYSASIEELERRIVERAESNLRGHLGIASLRNPFKSGLIHWGIDDGQELPGRASKIKDICEEMHDAHDTLMLLKGRSGCGKSSLMQRGVLSRLRQKEGALVLAFRPTDLGDGLRKQPDRLDRLWTMIAEVVNIPGHYDGGTVWRQRPRNYARRLCLTLRDRRADLVIGIDQFEEVIDELKLSADGGARFDAWTPVLQFLNELSTALNVRVIGTLESSREHNFLECRVEEAIGLKRKIISVEIGPDEVAEIARDGFARGGLPLDDRVLETIKTRWTAFEASDKLRSASPLPLACLFFSRLYEHFEHKAGATAGDRLQNDFARADHGAADRLLTLDDIGGEDTIAFENVIQKLADEAWRAAGGNPSFSDPIERDDGFSALNNFLGPCITVDFGGHIQLQAFQQDSADFATRERRAAFAARRLLVPARSSLAAEREDGRLLRLVHQAVINRWSPAQRWLAFKDTRLRTEYRFRKRAEYCLRFGETMPVDDQMIEAAAVTLTENHLRWQMRATGSGNIDDAAARDQALVVFGHARHPRIVIRPETGTTYVHLAASYHMIDLLDQFVRDDVGILLIQDIEGRNLLERASWSSGPAVKWLLDRGVPLKSPDFDWNAICASIQMDLADHFEIMVPRLGDLDEPIGPDGTRMVHSAALYGNLYVLGYLRDHFATMDVRDEFGRTALHHATNVCAFNYLLPLLSPLAVDRWGDTPVGLAAERGLLDVIQVFLKSPAVGDCLEAVLEHRNENGETPLMMAARYRRPEIVRCLLHSDLDGLIDPASPKHMAKDGRTLFHVAFSDDQVELTDEDRFRARDVVRILLEDRRLDPNQRDGNGRTPFDAATKFGEARALLRQDKRVPTDYAALTVEMRREDLSSRRIATVLHFIENSPQALTDRHDNETGLQILIRLKNFAALAMVVERKMVPWSQFPDTLEGVIDCAWTSAADKLRAALIQRVAEGELSSPKAARMVDASVRAKDWTSASALREMGVPFEPVRGVLGLTILHDTAIRGDLEVFAKIASLQVIALPVDDWHRRPSDLAPDTVRERFRSLEERSYAQPIVPTPLRPLKFHTLARDGKVDEFTCQARGVVMSVPLDEAGKRPSEVAPEEARDAIRAIEDRAFSGIQ